ncbi:hypothetical protein LAG90_15520 [Marinilongibacter aquaticus]|uniref:hypothetical protein n=1 Tax=Marinilongibacter aquaticus TaxID=2975157 RepID=UPI0021BDD684|nr:hypothetical protein [Marinilongibacter aquaticus]UBM58212.1 hypothetical protein LAG90_15520 [Marinilongibacter aquaticus]
MGTKVNLEVPEKLHLKMKREQLNREIEGEKINLRQLYYEVLELGLQKLEDMKKAAQK